MPLDHQGACTGHYADHQENMIMYKLHATFTAPSFQAALACTMDGFFLGSAPEEPLTIAALPLAEGWTSPSAWDVDYRARAFYAHITLVQCMEFKIEIYFDEFLALDLDTARAIARSAERAAAG